MNAAVRDKSALGEVVEPFPVPNNRQNTIPSAFFKIRRSRPSRASATSRLLQDMRWNVAKVSMCVNAVRDSTAKGHTCGRAKRPGRQQSGE